MTTMEDRIAACEALMRWFASQGMDEGEACNVASLFLALTIRGCARGDKSKQREGMSILAKQVRTIVEAQ